MADPNWTNAKYTSESIKRAKAAAEARQHPKNYKPTESTRSKAAKAAAYTALQSPWGSKARSTFYKEGKRAQSDVMAGMTRVRNSRGAVMKDSQGNDRGGPLTPKTITLAAAYTALQSPWGSRARNRLYMQGSRNRSAFIEKGADKLLHTKKGSAVDTETRYQKARASAAVGAAGKKVAGSKAAGGYTKAVTAPYKAREAVKKGVTGALSGL